MTGHGKISNCESTPICGPKKQPNPDIVITGVRVKEKEKIGIKLSPKKFEDI